MSSLHLQQVRNFRALLSDQKAILKQSNVRHPPSFYIRIFLDVINGVLMQKYRREVKAVSLIDKHPWTTETFQEAIHALNPDPADVCEEVVRAMSTLNMMNVINKWCRKARKNYASYEWDDVDVLKYFLHQLLKLNLEI